MKRVGQILIAAAILLIGCTPVEQPGAVTPEDEPTVAVTPEPSPSPSKTPTGETEPVGGEVDLSERTPVPLEPGDLEVTPMPDIPDHLRDLVQQMIVDLSERLGVSEADIRFLRADAVDWPDSSLGCPEPGMMYTQVITPGYQVIVEAEGQLHFYHTNGTEGFKYCADAAPVGDSPARE